MSTTDHIRLLVLQEFRLYAEDKDGAVARIVAATPPGIEPSLPLLTSIDDPRDVATLRALHGGESNEIDVTQHAALGPLVWSWAEPKHYGPRITERSQSPPSHFRLAVTESGINAGSDPTVMLGKGTDNRATGAPIGLVWVGAPIGTHAGLLVLLGSYGKAQLRRDPSGWPLPLSRDLGVRIYQSGT
ncbi:MAG TPA: hypothetical protein VGS01_05240 [Candidatus Limnocylindria bacterium]|jgi:hypothetical protein|nr:hypothetical protein [Candidatus Limnocylindria bacterium]